MVSGPALGAERKAAFAVFRLRFCVPGLADCACFVLVRVHAFRLAGQQALGLQGQANNRQTQELKDSTPVKMLIGYQL